MKKYAWIASFIALTLSAACIIYVPYDEDDRRISRGQVYERDYGKELDQEYFYDYLAPYGTWVSYPAYGYVWVPRHMQHGWRPYTSGRWVWTDYGWTWVSDFEWGWAPLPPEAEFVPGTGIRSFDFDFPPQYWVFVNARHFLDERLDRYALPFERNYTIIDFTMMGAGIGFRGGRVFNEGIDADRIGRFTHQEVTKYELRDPNRPGVSFIEGEDLFIHKPSISRNQLARPNTSLDFDEAEEKISAEEIEDEKARGQGLQDDQERERRLLEDSQEIEVNEIRRKVDDDKKLARTPEEREKVEEEYKAKIESLKKKHETEKSELSRRHKEEENKVKSSKLKRRDGIS